MVLRIVEWKQTLSELSGLVHGIAGRYASALFELTQELSDQDRQILAADMQTFSQMLDASSDLQKLVKSPIIGAEQQEAALLAVLDRAGFHALSRNFAGLVVRKRRAMFMADIIKQFAALMAASRGETIAQVATAVELTEAQIDEIRTVLSQSLDKAVIVEASVDPSLIAGMVVKAGSRMIDGSIKTKLNSLQQAMSEAG